MTRHLETIIDTDESSNIAFLSTVGGRIQKAAAAWTLGTTVYRQAKRIYQQQHSRRVFEVKVPGDNELYQPVEQWILNMLPTEEVRSVEALAGRWSQGRRTHKRSVIASFESNIDQKVIIAGHEMRVFSYTEEPTFDPSAGRSGLFSDFDMPTPSVSLKSKKAIKFECKTIEARDALLQEMSTLLLEHDDALPGSRCFILGGWGDWSRRDFMSQRPLNTVYLPDGMREAVTQDLERFLDSEKSYLRLGLPWHRGYLFSGTPGTGKTSLAKALSHHFELDIYVISLPDLKKDNDLTTALSRIETPAILLIEDIDVASASKSRDEEDGTLSLSGLLNALDGVGTPHGLITIMTSNHPEILDPALTRAGRVDYKLECPPMSGAELRLMVEEILEFPVDESFRDGIVAAEVMEVLKRNMHVEPFKTIEELVTNFGR